MPAQPYSSGRFAPSTPRSARLGINSIGKRPSSKQSAMIGVMCDSTYFLTSDWTSFSSSDSSVPIPKTSSPSNAIFLSLMFPLRIVGQIDYLCQYRYGDFLGSPCADLQTDWRMQPLQIAFAKPFANQLL